MWKAHKRLKMNLPYQPKQEEVGIVRIAVDKSILLRLAGGVFGWEEPRCFILKDEKK
jgi:hypothetical protein